jgi:SNF2 family DNA or RNA helicase
MSINQNLRNKIDQRAYELFEKGHQNDDVKNVNIRPNILSKLMPYQTLHTFNMINAIKNNTVSIDASYTGTGKTYTTGASCAQLDLIPFVICPKSIVNVWKSVMKSFNVKPLTVVNYETIRGLKYFDQNGCKVDCPYIRHKNTNDDGQTGDKKSGSFIWDFSSHPQRDRIIIIFDEAHRCKKSASLNGRLLLSCKNMIRPVKVLMLSATLCDRTDDFGIFGLMLGFYKKQNYGKSWLESIVREDKNKYGKNRTNTLHKYLFPEKGSKMSLEDLGEAFPINQISIESHTLDVSYIKKINRFYDEIVNNKNTIQLGNIIALRQRIENVKVGILIDQLNNYYEQNKSVVVFVNFVSTYDLICCYLKEQKIDFAEINGKQETDERQIEIDRFQNNEVRVIISMIQAGGTSISLHDQSGRFPRVSLISPSYSSIELIQTLGRVHRSGSKSPCLQKIIYCADTYEEEIANILRTKKQMLDRITDDDLNIEKKIITLTGNNQFNPKVGSKVEMPDQPAPKTEVKKTVRKTADKKTTVKKTTERLVVNEADSLTDSVDPDTGSDDIDLKNVDLNSIEYGCDVVAEEGTLYSKPIQK